MTQFPQRLLPYLRRHMASDLRHLGFRRRVVFAASSELEALLLRSFEFLVIFVEDLLDLELSVFVDIAVVVGLVSAETDLLVLQILFRSLVLSDVDVH